LDNYAQLLSKNMQLSLSKKRPAKGALLLLLAIACGQKGFAQQGGQLVVIEQDAKSKGLANATVTVKNKISREKQSLTICQWIATTVFW